MSTEEISEKMSHIPKYCRVYKDNVEYRYYPLILKREWDHYPNSYVAMYAKWGKYINPENHLFVVMGNTYENVVEKFLSKIEELQSQGKIKGKSWHGEIEHVDFENY